MDFAPTPATNLMETITGTVQQIPTLGNGMILADSVTTAGRAAINLPCANNWVSRTCFGASIICGGTATLCSGSALLNNYFGIPGLGVASCFAARGFNRLGKYSLKIGNFTNGNFTNVTDLTDFME